MLYCLQVKCVVVVLLYCLQVHYESHNESHYPTTESPRSGGLAEGMPGTAWPMPPPPRRPEEHNSPASHLGGGWSCSDTPTPSTLTTQTTPNTVVGGPTPSKKHASLFTWLTLQSIPSETVICPSIIDFLELALEPLPLPQPQKTPTDGADNRQDGEFSPLICGHQD